MARQVRRISELPEATELTGDELLEIVQGGENHRVRVGDLPGGGGGGAPGGLPSGGTQGQVLTKASDDDFDADWETPQGGGGGIDSIVAGSGIIVDDSDPVNPIVSATGSAGAEVNVQTSTAYTLVLTDAFKMVVMDNAGDNTLTVPPDTAVAFPANTRIDLGQDGAGQTTIAAGAGVTIRTPETLNLRKQWSKASLIRRAENVWDIVGDLEAAT